LGYYDTVAITILNNLISWFTEYKLSCPQCLL